MTTKTAAPKGRKPTKLEMSFLLMWHGVLTGAVLLTYLTGEDLYFMHSFAGYVVVFAILARLGVASIAPKGSPLALSLPLPSPGAHGRRTLTAWMAVAMVAMIGFAAFSGVLAEAGVGGLHEGLANAAPALIVLHIGLVLFNRMVKSAKSLTAADWGRMAETGVRVAETAARHTANAAADLAEKLAEEQRRRQAQKAAEARSQRVPSAPRPVMPRSEADNFGPKPKGLD